MTQHIKRIALAVAAAWIAFGGKPKEKKTEPVEPLVASCTVLGINRELTKRMNEAYKVHLKPQSAAAPVEYRVWLYNVSRLTHKIDNPILGHLKVPGNTSKKRYTMYTSLPQPLMLPRTDMDTEETMLYPTDARRVAMDIIHPDNLSLDQTLYNKYYAPTAVDRNLGIRGMFWSLNNPPKKDEVDAAILRMEQHYKDLLEQASYLDEATPEMHAAAEWFRITAPWHPVLS